MGAAFVITLREGIEAALIISILLAYLNAIDRRDRHGVVWAGTGLAVGVSLVAGGIVFWTAGQLSETAEEAFEGIASFLAVAVLTWMIFWMAKQARHIKSDLQHRVDLALVSGSQVALPALAFFVVVREGLETVLFLFATTRTASAGPGILSLVGGLLGLTTAAVLGYLIYRGGIRLNLRAFFRATGVLLLIIAGGLLANGIHELQEIGWLPWEDAKAFDIGGVLADSGGLGGTLKALFGYNADPSWLELGAWLGYLLVTGFLFFKPMRQERVPAPSPQPEQSERQRV